jgi:16S rRNA (cytosine967-C5)-methyltransferase
MRIALYQMLFLSKIPPPAAINESVEIVKQFKGERHAGVVNGVLRNILRNLQTIRYPVKEENAVLYDSVVYSHPQWMVRRYHERFGEQEAELLMQANNHRPMLTLRVNALRTTVEQVEKELDEAGITHERSPLHPSSILINSLRDVRFLPLFTEGHVSVQDVSASLAVQLAAPKPGMTVVDLCAAPGGKAIYAAELMQDQGTVLALEKYESKLRFINENAERLGVKSITAQQGDAREVALDKQADLVLVDAPCSGLGTLSKKPDIKWRRDLDDVRTMAKLQREILDHAATLVRTGGAIVYSTCTIEPEENQDVVKDFLARHPEFMLQPAEELLPVEVCAEGFMQSLPHRHKTDGAFAARLVKR